MAHCDENQLIHLAHICENDMIQIKDMFQIVATWLQFSTEEYFPKNEISANMLVQLNLQQRRRNLKVLTYIYSTLSVVTETSDLVKCVETFVFALLWDIQFPLSMF